MHLMAMLLKNTDATHLKIKDGNQLASGNMIKYNFILIKSSIKLPKINFKGKKNII